MSHMTKSLVLSTGQRMPVMGLGTCSVASLLIIHTGRAEPNVVKSAVLTALQLGYRHIDCAYVYENEKEVGEALKETPVPRNDIFVTSKLWNTFHEPALVQQGCKQTLQDLGLSFLDLYLVHWPIAHVNDGTGNAVKDPNTGVSKINTQVCILETWREMEKLVDLGLVKAIGVSNFNISKLQDLLKEARIKPVVNQVEMHPYLPQHDLLAYCQKEGIAVTAYSPLGSNPKNGVLADTKVSEIAKSHNKSPAQILLAWGIQRDTIVIPKSSNAKRIQENFESLQVTLTDSEMQILNELYKVHRKRYIDPKTFWKVDIFEE